MNEFELIENISRMVPLGGKVLKGIGDDTAVIRINKSSLLLITTDMLAEGVHFTNKDPAQLIGRKALACSISDIAAMGGIPRHAVVSVGIPSRAHIKRVKDMYKGLGTLAKEFNISVVGGDTIKSKQLIINVALMGEIKAKDVVLRSGAKKGDQIFVTGPLGNSLKNKKHLNFAPQVSMSQFLVKKFKPNAMIDISDGLVADLGHMIKQSRKGADLFRNQIPLAPGATLHNALYDGEDFELLFTLPRPKANRLMSWQIKNHCWYFYPIGQIHSKNARVSMSDAKGKTKALAPKGYKHF